MNTQCPACQGTQMKVVKTFPYEDHTLRQLKCRSCGNNIFTHEYIMQSTEYSWQRVEKYCRLRLLKQ